MERFSYRLREISNDKTLSHSNTIQIHYRRCSALILWRHVVISGVRLHGNAQQAKEHACPYYWRLCGVLPMSLVLRGVKNIEQGID